MSILAILAAAAAQAATAPPPIIDMHMHAMSVAEFGNESPKGCIAAEGVEMHGVDPGKAFDFTAQATCKRMVAAPSSDAALVSETLQMMDRYNIVSAVLEGDPPIIDKWRAAAPRRFILGRSFFVDGTRPPAKHAASLSHAQATPRHLL